MFPPTKKVPKRVGGAPFTIAPGARRAARPLPQSARDVPPAKRAVANGNQVLSNMPASARCPPTSTSEVGRGDGSITPLTKRAEQHYARLMGRASTTDADTRQDWILVEELDTLDHINREERQRQRIRERNLKHQAELQQQLQSRNHIAEKCKEAWVQWGKDLRHEDEQYKKEEEQKRAHILGKQDQVRQERERNLDEVRRRKAAQKEAELKVDLELLQQAEQAQRKLDEADEKKKRDQKLAMQQVYADVQAMEKERKFAKERERQRDIEEQRQFAELLEKRERERDQQYQSIKDKQQKFWAKYQEGVGDQLAKNEAMDDERCRNDQQARYEKEKRDNEERERWRQKLRESSRDAVKKQLALQAEERQRAHQEEQRYLQQKQREVEMEDAKEQEKSRKRKEAMQDNADYLRRQIEEQSKRGPRGKLALGQMSEIERSFNRERLERAYNSERADGLPMLVCNKRAEYLRQQAQREQSTSAPC